ncbi:MAP kinase kinase (MEK) [Apiospora arundinis]|uniref:Uncharacterized protein n=1 Tax=Apiospora arundinis TaxID=335852 RepID=A0ABR2I398_9PEZI
MIEVEIYTCGVYPWEAITTLALIFDIRMKPGVPWHSTCNRMLCYSDRRSIGTGPDLSLSQDLDVTSEQFSGYTPFHGNDDTSGFDFSKICSY